MTETSQQPRLAKSAAGRLEVCFLCRDNEVATAGYPRERCFDKRVKDLWLSATGAVLNGG
jgi:hypothetical protein